MGIKQYNHAKRSKGTALFHRKVTEVYSYFLILYHLCQKHLSKYRFLPYLFSLIHNKNLSFLNFETKKNFSRLNSCHTDEKLISLFEYMSDIMRLELF